MKALLFIISVFLIGSSVQAQVHNADTMVHRIFTALKMEDSKAYISIQPNVSQLTKLMMGMSMGLTNEVHKSQPAGGSDVTEREESKIGKDSIIKVFTKTAVEEINFLQKIWAREFATALQRGKEKGIDWSDAELISYTIDTTVMDKRGEKKVARGIKGEKGMRGELRLKSKGNVYHLLFDRLMFLPDEGWFGVSLGMLLHESEIKNKEGNSISVPTIGRPTQ